MRQAFFFLFFYSLLLSKFLMLAPCNLYCILFIIMSSMLHKYI
jgi:hypothetical protein